MSHFCRQTGKNFSRRTFTTRHILQRQKIPLKGCSQKAFIKATSNAGFPDDSEGSTAPKAAVHGGQLRIPAPMQVLISRVEKQHSPPRKAPAHAQALCRTGYSLPQRCPDLCQAAGSLQPCLCFYLQFIFLLLSAALVSTQFLIFYM